MAKRVTWVPEGPGLDEPVLALLGLVFDPRVTPPPRDREVYMAYYRSRVERAIKGMGHWSAERLIQRHFPQEGRAVLAGCGGSVGMAHRLVELEAFQALLREVDWEASPLAGSRLDRIGPQVDRLDRDPEALLTALGHLAMGQRPERPFDLH